MSKLTVDEWVQKLGAADATHLSDAQAAATVILEELGLYGMNAPYDPSCHGRHIEMVREDMNTLANALIAFAKLYIQHGLEP